MSYRVLCDGYVLHDSNLEQFTLISPKADVEVNKSGEFNFQILNNHPYYDKIINKKSYIEIYENGKWLWGGRPIKVNTSLKLAKTVTCEGELSFLHDSNQRLAEYHNISVSDYFKAIINKHNAMVGEDKQFTVGNVTVEDTNDSLYRYSNYEDTFDTIQEKLIDKLGGYLLIRHENGVRYIDYLKEYPYITNQMIQIGSNIIDLSLEDNSSDTISALIPLGKKISEINGETSAQENDTEERLTIESVNDGLDYIVNEDAVSRLGLVFGVQTWDDVTIPSNLLKKGYEELTDRIYSNLTISLNIFDRSFIEENIDSFKLGATVICDSPKHGLYQKQMMISSMSISLVDISQNTITIGSNTKSITSNITESNNSFDTRVETITNNIIKGEELTVIYPKIQEVSSKIDQTAEQITSEVSQKYMLLTEKDAIYQYVQTMVSQSATEITMSFRNDLTEVENQVVVNKQEIDKYIRFSANGIELGDMLSPFKAQISNVKISFLQNNQEIAYISNNTLYITKAMFLEKISIGNSQSGQYDWIIRTNGNMSLKYRDWGGD